MSGIKMNYFRHLEDVNESYGEHFYHAMCISLFLLKLSFICALHAIHPDVFEKGVSNRLGQLDKLIYRK